jgi:hypothetical protein
MIIENIVTSSNINNKYCSSNPHLSPILTPSDKLYDVLFYDSIEERFYDAEIDEYIDEVDLEYYGLSVESVDF